MSDTGTPDSAIATLMAVDSIEDVVMLINGPTGCKFYPAAMSEALSHRGASLDPMANLGRWSFGQARIPCTYLDGDDYVNGSLPRLEEALGDMVAAEPTMVVVVNSPGASMIGDDVLGTVRGALGDVPFAVIESPPVSQGMGKGLQVGTVGVLEAIGAGGCAGKTVNLLGMSMWDRAVRDDIAELSSLLAHCGIGVNCAVGADWSLATAEASKGAMGNVMVHREHGDIVAGWYRDMHGIECAEHEAAPFGYDDIEAWLMAIGDTLSIDVTGGLEVVKNERRRVAHEIARFNSISGLPRGATFSVRAGGSLALAIVRTLHSYLGMVPSAVQVPEGPTDALIAYLGDIGLADAVDVRDLSADVLLADGNTIINEVTRDNVFAGVEVASPTARMVEVQHQPTLGTGGTARVIDALLNALTNRP